MTLSDFYSSKAWREFRQAYISEQLAIHGEIICSRCGKPITQMHDCILHHKEHLTPENFEDAYVALNPDNIECLHLRCHNEEHQKGWKWNGERKVFLIYGPPNVGKTTYARSLMHEKDLLVDVDEIYKAINNSRSAVLIGTVIRCRNLLLDEVRYRQGKWQDAYIVGGFPQAIERKRLVEDLGATPILMMEERDELYRREKESGRGRCEFIDDWFSTWTRTGGAYGDDSGLLDV